VTCDDFFLHMDNSGKVSFIPSLIGETLGQLAAWNVMVSNNFTARPVAGVVSKACFHRSVHPGETLYLESTIDSLDEHAVNYHSEAFVGEESVFTIEHALGPLLQMNDFIDSEEVKRQFQEINRPGVWEKEQPISSIFKPGSNFTSRSFEFDRIIESHPGLSLRAEKKISRSAAYFSDHFPRKPVLPLTVLLECKINLARYFLKISPFSVYYHIFEMRKIKMNEFVYPGDVIQCHLNVKTHNEDELVLSFRSEVNNKRVCVLEIVLKKGAL
jgi:3-hydroxymyristoyl/3-hydroxydecanoyl-(acyl carrier protein) dehydratase